MHICAAKNLARPAKRRCCEAVGPAESPKKAHQQKLINIFYQVSHHCNEFTEFTAALGSWGLADGTMGYLIEPWLNLG